MKIKKKRARKAVHLFNTLSKEGFMLYDLSFLEEGKSWPPEEEMERLQRYGKNRAVFEGEHHEVYAEQFRRVERVLGNFKDVVSYPIVLNFQRLIAIKFADLLFGEEPRIGSAKADATVRRVCTHSGLIGKAVEVAIDVCRYGTGLFLVYRDDEGRGVVDVTQPACWFPVLDSANVKRVLYHVLAVEVELGDRAYLKVQIHEPGAVIMRTYELEGGVIGKILEDEGPILTGLDSFALLPVQNIATSESYFGGDDFASIDSIVSEIEVRMAQISKILDKHAAPTITGPGSALVDDGAGGLVLGTGNYIVNDALIEGGGEVKYVTWNAQLEASFRQLDVLLGFLYTMSETGATLLDASPGVGAAAGGSRGQSGTALRLRMMAPLSKVNRMRVRFDPVLRRAVAMAAGLGWGGRLEAEDVSIIWEDGLPDDPRESAEIMHIRTAGRATLSQMEAVKRLDGVDEQVAGLITRQIRKDGMDG